jgi:hypothetical protein
MMNMFSSKPENPKKPEKKGNQWAEKAKGLNDYAGQQVDSVKGQLMHETANALRTTNASPNQILDEYSRVRNILDTSKTQIEREGAQFTKQDLIAILCGLDPLYKTKNDDLKHMTVPVLNGLIRAIIYSPERLLAPAAPEPIKPAAAAKKPKKTLQICSERAPQPYQLVDLSSSKANLFDPSFRY